MMAIVAVTNVATVIVEASRLDQTALEMPAAVQVITADELGDIGANDLVHALAFKAPSLHLHRMGGANPALAELATGGYGENGHGRLAVLVDGERLNSPDINPPNLAQVAVGAIDHIEVMNGSQAVTLGNGASAGAINIITEPRDYERHHRLELHGGSWGTIGGAVGSRGGFAEQGVKYWADGGWERSDGYRSNSAYELWNVNAGVKRAWQNGSYLRFSAFYSYADYALPGWLTDDEMSDDRRQTRSPADRYRRAAYGFSPVLKLQLNDENALKVTGNLSNRQMHGYQQGESGGYSWFSDNEYDIWCGRLLAEWTNTAELFGHENEFLLGVTGGGDWLNGCQRSDYSVQSPRYDRMNADIFAQETFRFSDEWALQLGCRHSQLWSYNNLCEEKRRNDGPLAADLAIVCNPVENAKLYAKWSRFYRAPFLDEVPGRYDANYNWVNTRLLTPETGWTAELGGEWADDELKLGARVHYTRLKDEIFYNSLSGNNVNSGDDTCRYGVDARIAWERRRLAGFALAASWTRANFDGGDFGHNRVPFVPELTLTADARVWLTDECWAFGGYRLQSDMFAISDFGNDGEKIDWYGVFRLGLAWEPTFAAWVEGLRLTVAVENLFDEEFSDYATAYGGINHYWPGDGRSFTVSASYQF